MLDSIEFSDFGTNEIKLPSQKIKFSNLNLFIGKNATGKSLLFKTAWFISTALNIYKLLFLARLENADQQFEQEINNIFDLTFHQSEQLSGSIRISDTSGGIYIFDITMQDGKLDHFNIEIKDPKKFKEGEIQNVRFNSKEARTFDQYEKYIRIKKMLGLNELIAQEDFQKLGEFYRLYDIMWFEDILKRIHVFEEEPQKLQKILSAIRLVAQELVGEVRGFKPTENLVAKDDFLYVEDQNQQLTNIASLSSGEQAILMMILFSGDLQ